MRRKKDRLYHEIPGSASFARESTLEKRRKAPVPKKQSLDKLIVSPYSTCVCRHTFRAFFVRSVIAIKKNKNYVYLPLLRVQFLIKLDELHECV